MKQFEVRNYRLDRGKHCFMSQGRLSYLLSKKYGRNPDSIALKVFDCEEIKSREDFEKVNWGDDPKEGEPRLNTKLLEACMIQNICAMHGLAPKIYGLETVLLANRLSPVQVASYLSGRYANQDEAMVIYNDVKKLGEIYGFSTAKDDVSADDAIAGKLIDFQTFKFNKPYEETVREIYNNDGKYGKVYYQNVTELGLNGGPRQSDKRIEYMKLDTFNFTDKNVLDVGCAGGHFLRYADNRGAKRCLGVDVPKIINAAKHLNNLLGHFNIDFTSTGEDGAFDFQPRHYYGIEGFDVVFFLSMNMHIGLPDSVINAMNPGAFMFFEKNGRETDEAVEAMLKEKFEKVELLGRAEDHGNKPIYLCIKAS